MKIPNDCFVHAVINKKIINGNKRDAINNIQKEFYEYCVSHGFPDEFRDEFKS